MFALLRTRCTSLYARTVCSLGRGALEIHGCFCLYVSVFKDNDSFFLIGKKNP